MALERRLPPLGPNEVVVVRSRAGADGALLARCRSALVARERDRALSHRREPDRDAFVLRRGLLRLLLGELLGVAPAAVPLVTSPSGRPLLGGAPGIDFSVSDSGEHVRLAIARGLAVGVDVERLRAVEPLAVARRFYTPREVRWLEALEPAQLTMPFLRLWAVKEAVVKAEGSGLSQGLAGLDVLPDPPRHLRRNTPWTVRGWRVRLLEEGPPLVTALATSVEPKRVVEIGT